MSKKNTSGFRAWLRAKSLSLGGRLLMKSLGSSLRMTAQTRESVACLRPQGKGLIFAMWHGPHFPVLWAYRNHGMNVISSHSRDGQILTDILKGAGYQVVRGSSSRGGISAMIELTRQVETGSDAAIAVDGPRGPNRVTKPGIIRLAKLTGSPIVPVGAAVDRYWEFRSWDQYRLPKPFAKAFVVTGDPMWVPSDAVGDQLEAFRVQLDQSLGQIQAVAEENVGHVQKMKSHLANYE